MNKLSYNNASLVRRRIAVVLLATIALVALLFAFGGYPLQKRSSQLGLEVRKLDSRIASYTARHGEVPLSEKVAAAARKNTDMENAWNTLKERVKTFESNGSLAEILASSEEGRIDYKVALYDARQRIAEEADNLDIEIPSDLGMEETIDTDEVMESKLWQLAANVCLMKKVIESDVAAVDSIKVLDPIAFLINAFGESYMLLYPVRICLQCDFESLLGFLESPDRFFALQRLMIHKQSVKKNAPIKVTAVCSAFLFRDDLPKLEEAESEEEPSANMGSFTDKAPTGESE